MCNLCFQMGRMFPQNAPRPLSTTAQGVRGGVTPTTSLTAARLSSPAPTRGVTGCGTPQITLCV